MKPVRLVAWREEEGRCRAAELAQKGWPVAFDSMDPGTLLGVLKKEPPEAVVIDLSRSPSQGRDLGVALRVRGATRRILLVFAGGAPDKVEGVRKVLPDAEFSCWDSVPEALDRAFSNPPVDPVVPDSMLAGYSGTPLPRKLGIKAGSQVLLAGAPEDFVDTLGELPPDVRLVRRYGPKVDVVLWFVRSGAELEREVTKWSSRVGREGIWIIWPKKGSGLRSDLKQDVVRRTGLSAGLVDYKIAALDRTWSGLKFAVRK